MNKTSFRKKLLLGIVVSTLLSAAAQADNIEFDDYILQSLGFDNIDLSAFAGSNDQFAGEYLADITLNGQRVVRDYSVYFYTDKESHLCFTEDLMTRLAIKKNYLSDIKEKVHEIDAGICYPVEFLDEAVSVEFDSGAQRIDIRMPQKFLGNIDPHWVQPKDRDHGINGVILDYSLLWEFARYDRGGDKESSSSIRSFGTAGFNLGQFRFRADYQYSSKIKEGSKLEWNQIYGFTDIASMNAKLYAGELYTRSNSFDSTRIKGVSLYSDEGMMPSYLKGYAPQITGVATSNAVVVLKQYGSIIRTVQVPAGPFVISDLPSYINGTVDVEIEETNGEIRRYQVDIAHVPFLTRKGGIRYFANIGKLDPFSGTKVDTKLISVDGSYGLTNHLSLFGGVQFTTNREYKAFNIGLGLNLEKFGALSFDVTRSESTIIKTDNGKDYKGHSYRFNYAKRFSSDTTLNIAGYRFSSREFTSLNNYLSFVQGGFRNTYLEKNRISLSISQYVPQWDISLTGSISKGSYWNKDGSSNYNLTMSKNIKTGVLKNTSVSLSLSQENNSSYADKDRRIALYVSIPLQEDRGSIQYSSQYGSREKYVDHQITYSNSGLGGYYTIGSSINHKRDLSGGADFGFNATYSADTGYGQAMVMADYSDYRQGIRTSFDGSLTLTQHGIATHRKVYGDGSRLILDAGAVGVPMQGGQDVSNTFGLIGVSNTTSYYRGNYMVDNDNLPDNVEIQDGVVQVAMSDGAIAYRSLGGISGEKAIARVTLSDGSYPPFGSAVYRSNGNEQEVAIVAEEGLTYLTGLIKNAEYIIKWNGSQSCQIKINSLDTTTLNNLTCY